MNPTSRTTLRRAVPLAIAGLALAPALLHGEGDVRCLGTEAVCTANVSIDGGASNEKVTVQLPGTALKLRATTPVPADLKGAFGVSGGIYAMGGSAYQFTLNAVESIGNGFASMTFTNPARPQAGPAGTVRCLGDDAVCTAHVSLSGGAGNKRIKVLLPGTDLTLAAGARAVTPASSKGAYSIGRGGYSMGGSAYSFTLNAVASLGKGAWLVLTFRAPR